MKTVLSSPGPADEGSVYLSSDTCPPTDPSRRCLSSCRAAFKAELTGRDCSNESELNRLLSSGGALGLGLGLGESTAAQVGAPSSRSLDAPAHSGSATPQQRRLFDAKQSARYWKLKFLSEHHKAVLARDDADRAEIRAQQYISFYQSERDRALTHVLQLQRRLDAMGGNPRLSAEEGEGIPSYEEGVEDGTSQAR
ncbi:hypothetical protein BV25DRAFT_1843163 [Artomyces pyxidatus]|uniref:Uncharacterized protein n=1 Tax=Artomyces pyxidatus TaxID=48021 RepID=A0ACB8SGZ3_9AGAM|nr:hypothetical protein BV25DRAFT_1843163 [Artomyces pyxidatus]